MVREVKNKLSLAGSGMSRHALSKLKDLTVTNKFILAGQKALIGAGFFALTPLSVFAVPENVNPVEMVNKLVSLVCTMFSLIGAILLVWAIGQLVLAFKNEDADSKSRAMQVLVVAVLLCSVKLIYAAITGESVVDFSF